MKSPIENPSEVFLEKISGGVLWWKAPEEFLEKKLWYKSPAKFLEEIPGLM